MPVPRDRWDPACHWIFTENVEVMSREILNIVMLKYVIIIHFLTRQLIGDTWWSFIVIYFFRKVEQSFG